MALFRWKKGNGDDDGGNGDATADQSVIVRDARKARAWFEQARKVTDTGNYAYAISLYVSGLKFDPDNVAIHEALRDVALRYKVGDGKPVGFGDKPPVSGKSPLEKMLAAEYKWSKDLANGDLALEVMENAVALWDDDEDNHMGEVAHWVGEHAVAAQVNAKKPDKKKILRIRDLYAEIGDFIKALEVGRHALRIDPNDHALADELSDMEAEAVIQKSKLDEEGDFTKSIKDKDTQEKLEQQDSLARSEDQQKQLLKTLRDDHENNPDDQQVFDKLIRALTQADVKAQEDEAIERLIEYYKKSGQYRYKMQVGDIRMKQFKRGIRALKTKFEADPSNAELRKKYNQALLQQVQLELNEYAERVKNYPTDLNLKFQLGIRQLKLQKYDDAVASFQEAQADPKNRSAALAYLGEAFAGKGWWDEAIDTFRRGIDLHESETDGTALMLRYDLMNALEQKAEKERNLELAEEASKIGSKIAQTNINFRDIRDRLTRVREFIEELRNGNG